MIASASHALRASAAPRCRAMATHVGVAGTSSLKNAAVGTTIFGFVGGVYYYTISMMSKEADIFAELDSVIDEADRERTGQASPGGKSQSSNALAHKKKIGGMQIE